MAVDQLPAAPDMTTAEAEVLVMERKRKAAEAATNVGDMNTRFKTEVDDLMQNPQPEASQQPDPLAEIYANAHGEGGSMDDGIAPETLKQVAKTHVDEMEEASDGKEATKLMQDDPRKLGQNRIGGGDASMELNAEMYARLDGTRQRIHQINLTWHHESAHGRQGDAPIEWLEGHAEISANEANGLGMNEHREGQPAELYGAGQETVARAVTVIGRSTVEDGMTRDFSIIIRELMVSEDPAAKELLRDIAASN